MTTDAVETLRPRHVGVVMDGNRRWARLAGLVSPSEGHRKGADHIEDLLGWCETRGIDHVSIYVLSADNIRKRSASEVGFLFGLATRVLPGIVTRTSHWSLHVSGDLSLLPDEAAAELRSAETQTSGRLGHVTLAIAYDGRADIVAGIRGAVRAGALETDGGISPADITAHLAGGPVKDSSTAMSRSSSQRSGPRRSARTSTRTARLSARGSSRRGGAGRLCGSRGSRRTRWRRTASTSTCARWATSSRSASASSGWAPPRRATRVTCSSCSTPRATSSASRPEGLPPAVDQDPPIGTRLA